MTGLANVRSSRRGAGVRSRARQAIAFTLIELLVVVSIIALLISILLPSLKQARDQAKLVKCLAHQRAIGQASTGYQTDYEDWLPGSPGTSGLLLIKQYSDRPSDAVDIPEPPVQIWDWAGPLAADQMNMSLPVNRAERFQDLSTGVFECPANRLRTVAWPPQPAGSAFDRPYRQISYHTIRQFMYFADEHGSPTSWAVFPTGWPVHLAPGYKPRIDRVGTPSEKVFIADGSRYTTQEGTLDFSISWDAGYGGAFSDGGPTLPDRPGEFYLRSYWRTDPARRYSYRHGPNKEPGLAVTYYDGHSGYMSEKKSRWPDPWWPKGTVIERAEFNGATMRLIMPIMAAQGWTEWHVMR